MEVRAHPARVRAPDARALSATAKRVVDGALRLTYAAVLRALRSLVGGAAAARRQGRRPRRLHRAEHARAARVVLRRAADRRRARADQLPAQPGRVRLHHQPLGRDRRLRARGLPRVPSTAIRPQLPGVAPLRRARRSARRVGSTTRRSSSEASPDFAKPEIGERDLLTINYTSGTTSRPKGVMITHRNAYMNTVGTLLHLPMRLTDRYLWTLPMFHANGWTFVWTVTAVGADARLPAQDRAGEDVRADPDRARVDALRRADGADRRSRARRPRLAGERAARACAW